MFYRTLQHQSSPYHTPRKEKLRKCTVTEMWVFFLQHFASGHYESALLAICAGDAEDY